MSNHHVIEYCDHRAECKNKSRMARLAEGKPEPDDVAYCDESHCGRFPAEGGAEVILTGVWRKRNV